MQNVLKVFTVQNGCIYHIIGNINTDSLTCRYNEVKVKDEFTTFLAAKGSY